MRVVGLLLDECERVLPLLESPVLSERWAEPSALAQWSNGGLPGTWPARRSTWSGRLPGRAAAGRRTMP